MSEQLQTQENAIANYHRDEILNWLSEIAKHGLVEGLTDEYKSLPQNYSMRVIPKPILPGITTGFTHIRHMDGQEVDISEMHSQEHNFDIHGPHSYSESVPFENGKRIYIKQLDNADPKNVVIAVSTDEHEATKSAFGQSSQMIRDEILVHIAYLSSFDLDVTEDQRPFMEERRVG